MKEIKGKSNSIGGSMSKLTERLIQAASVAVVLFVIWNISANTVIALVKKNMEISNLQRQVQVLQQRGVKK